MRHYASSLRKEEWIREIRGEGLQGIAEGTSRASRLASSSATLVPRRNECPGTHCSLVEQYERKQFLSEIKVKGKMEEKTKWRGQSENQIVGEEKWQTCWCCRDQQRACRMAQASVERLEHSEPAEKKMVASVPQIEQLASTPEPSLPKEKGKESSVQSLRS